MHPLIPNAADRWFVAPNGDEFRYWPVRGVLCVFRKRYAAFLYAGYQIHRAPVDSAAHRDWLESAGLDCHL